MTPRRTTSFELVLLVALGGAASLVASLLLVQLVYLGESIVPLGSLFDSDVRSAIWLSLWTSTVSGLLALFVAVPAAYALARRRFRGRVVVDALLDVPIVLSPIVVGLALVLIFRTSPGRWVEDHLVQFIFAVPGIMAAQFVLALALQVRVLKAAFDELDPRNEQVARVLGCTPWQAFLRVTLPMSRTAILAAFVLGWCRALGDFGATVTLAGAVRGKTETIPMAIYNQLATVRVDRALGLALLLTFLALLVLMVVRGLSERGKG